MASRNPLSKFACRAGAEAHFFLEQDGHAAKFSDDLAVADGSGFAEIFFEVVKLEVGIESQFPLIPSHGGKRSEAAVVEERLKVFVPRNDLRPFLRRVPRSSQGDGRIE